MNNSYLLQNRLQWLANKLTSLLANHLLRICLHPEHHCDVVTQVIRNLNRKFKLRLLEMLAAC